MLPADQRSVNSIRTGSPAFAWLSAATIVLGILLLGLWTATDHVWAYRNTNLLFFHPLWFAVIPLVRHAGRPLSRIGAIVLGLCLILAVGGLAVAVARIPQDSAQMAALALPPIAATVWFTGRRRRATA